MVVGAGPGHHAGLTVLAFTFAVLILQRPSLWSAEGPTGQVGKLNSVKETVAPPTDQTRSDNS